MAPLMPAESTIKLQNLGRRKGVLTYPSFIASYSVYSLLLFIFICVRDTLRLILFVSTRFCSLASFSANFTINHLATC